MPLLFLSYYLPLLCLPAPHLVNDFILLALQLFTQCACVRSHASGNRLRFLKHPGSVTWTAAASSSKRQVAICGPRMCRHFLPPIDRPITKRPVAIRPSEQDGEHVVMPSTIPDSRISRKNGDGPGMRPSDIATKRETVNLLCLWQIVVQLFERFIIYLTCDKNRKVHVI